MIPAIIPPDMPDHHEAAQVLYVERRHRVGAWGFVEHFPATFIPFRGGPPPGTPTAAEPRAVPPDGSGRPYLATCPMCAQRPTQPEARSCERLGCPIRDFVSADHGTGGKL